MTPFAVRVRGLWASLRVGGDVKRLLPTYLVHQILGAWSGSALAAWPRKSGETGERRVAGGNSRAAAAGHVGDGGAGGDAGRARGEVQIARVGNVERIGRDRPVRGRAGVDGGGGPELARRLVDVERRRPAERIEVAVLEQARIRGLGEDVAPVESTPTHTTPP